MEMKHQMVRRVRADLVADISRPHVTMDMASHQHSISLARSDMAAQDWFFFLFNLDLDLELGDQVLAP
jgi:hypothetical protein